MGYVDTIKLLDLEGDTDSSGASSVIDLSGYAAGCLSVVTENFGTKWTPTLTVSPDGTNFATPGTGEVANFAQVAAVGVVRYPLLLPAVVFGKTKVTWANAGLSFTATNANPCVFTAAGSALANDTPVLLSGASLPTGFTAATTYWVVGASGTSFSLAATKGGSALASTGSGSGTVTAGVTAQVIFQGRG